MGGPGGVLGLKRVSMGGMLHEFCVPASVFGVMIRQPHQDTKVVAHLCKHQDTKAVAHQGCCTLFLHRCATALVWQWVSSRCGDAQAKRIPRQPAPTDNPAGQGRVDVPDELNHPHPTSTRCHAPLTSHHVRHQLFRIPSNIKELQPPFQRHPAPPQLASQMRVCGEDKRLEDPVGGYADAVRVGGDQPDG